MAPSAPKLSASLASGISMLALQAVVAPFALVGLLRADGLSPRWLIGLYVALELGVVASAILVAWGMHAKHPWARLAPAVLLLPYWTAVGIAGPLVHDGVGALLFGGFSLAMGAVTAFPFLTRTAKAHFDTR